MKTVSIDTLISFGSLLLGFGTTLTGVMIWYVNSERKKYAAERDFNHIRRNQEQMQQSLTYLLTELEKRFDTVERDVLEIKTVLGLNRHHD